MYLQYSEFEYLQELKLRYNMGDCVFTIFGVCVFTKVETYETIIESISLVAKRHQHLLMSMEVQKKPNKVTIPWCTSKNMQSSKNMDLRMIIKPDKTEVHQNRNKYV